jgi:hypothetical protein
LCAVFEAGLSELHGNVHVDAGATESMLLTVVMFEIDLFYDAEMIWVDMTLWRAPLLPYYFRFVLRMSWGRFGFGRLHANTAGRLMINVAR